MKKIISISCVLLFISTHFFAQSIRAYEKAGDEALAKDQFYAAYTYFQTALSSDETLARLQYKFAKAAFHWQSYEEAITYFKKASEDETLSSSIPTFEYDWGLAEMALGNYSEAKILFQRSLRKKGFASSEKKLSKSKIKACEAAQAIIQRPIEITIDHPDKTINSSYSDFGAIEKDDILYLSSLKFKDKQKSKTQYFSRILSTEKNTDEKAKPLRKKINLSGVHNAHTTFSQDGEWMYFTRCKNLPEGGIRCKIYRRKLGEKRPKDELLPENINLEEYTATHPNIGFDTVANKEYLFFASDRKGGKGKLDIWVSEINSDGQFLKPKNLGRNINTAGDEVTPFFHNQLLYFSSDFHTGLGGFDVFKSKKMSKTQWTKPKNMGYPLNSSYNDLYYVLNENGYTGYFSSNRKGAFLLSKNACCNDVFSFELPKPAPVLPEKPIQSDSLVLAQNEVDSSTQPTEVENVSSEEPILTFEEELSKMLPISLYFDNDQPNPRTLKTTTSINYETTFQQYYNRKNIFIQKFTSPLVDFEKENATNTLDYFFENEVKNGYEKLNRLIELLLIELSKGRTIEIYIKGYTSQLAASDYNVNLSKRRISSVKNYLNEAQNGILSVFIITQQLKIIEVPFGEEQSKEKVLTKDKRNSIYSVDASKERRVEIIEVK